MRFTETDIKYFKSGSLRTITNIAQKEYTLYDKLKKKKRIPSQVYFKDFFHRYRTTFQNVRFFTGINFYHKNNSFKGTVTKNIEMLKSSNSYFLSSENFLHEHACFLFVLCYITDELM